MKDNYSKRRYYLNKKGQNSSYASPYNQEKQNFKEVKNSDKIINSKRYLGLNSDTSEATRNLNNKNYHKNRTIINEDILLNQKKSNNNYLQRSNDNIFINNENNKNNKYLDSKNILNKTNKNINNNNKRYSNYMQKVPDYKTVIQNNYNSLNVILNNHNFYNEDKYKNKNKKININNYDYNKIFTNQSYDITKDKYNNKFSYAGKKPVESDKKRSYRFSTYNSYIDKRKIIKIQSVWRGYFLRKIAVGSIKKYIGFIAIMRYLGK